MGCFCSYLLAPTPRHDLPKLHWEPRFQENPFQLYVLFFSFVSLCFFQHKSAAQCGSMSGEKMKPTNAEEKVEILVDQFCN